MIVLALDTALNACSACAARDGAVVASLSEPMVRGHQERLAPMAAEVMARAALRFDRLDRIGVVVGPGSFTGLRVGLAFAKGLALALEVPCIGTGTLEALAAGAPGVVASVIAGKPGQVYVQAFAEGAPLMPAQLLQVEEAAERVRVAAAGRPLILTGPGAPLLAVLHPQARIDAREAVDVEAFARMVASAPEPSRGPAPLYLRPPDARTLAERAAQP